MANNIMTFDSDDFGLFYSSDGTDFTEITGITGFSVNPDPGTSRTVRTFKGSTNVEQREGPGQLTIDVGNFTPHLQQWKALRAHKRAGDILTFRTRSRAKQEIFAVLALVRLVAIATTGIATLSGTGKQDAETDLAVGHILTVDGNDYSIESITGPDTFTVNPKPAAAVAAMTYAVTLPQITRDVMGKVLSMDADNLSEGAQLANAITVSLRAVPGDWSVV